MSKGWPKCCPNKNPSFHSKDARLLWVAGTGTLGLTPRQLCWKMDLLSLGKQLYAPQAAFAALLHDGSVGPVGQSA